VGLSTGPVYQHHRQKSVRSVRYCHPATMANIVPAMDSQFVCVECGEPQLASPYRITCGKCGGAMDLAPGGAPVEVSPSVTMGEGNTPVVRLKHTGAALGCEELFGKLEFLNPTGSFKDRGSVVLISMLKQMGIGRVAEDSSGNAGASVAAYAARAGMQATIFAPETAPEAKLAQIGFYGAEVRRVSGGRQAVADECLRFCQENEVVYASHNLSPYFIEGTKKLATEVSAQMESPDHILFPVGNGSLLIGTWKGYQELANSSPGTRVPRLHAVQSRECMPLAAGYAGEEWRSKTGGIRTVAGGIAVERPPRLGQCIGVLRESGGTAVAVEEGEIIEWQRRLAREDGIFVEPTSAAALAGLEVLLERGDIGREDRVLVPLTGFGLKDVIPG